VPRLDQKVRAPSFAAGVVAAACVCGLSGGALAGPADDGLTPAAVEFRWDAPDAGCPAELEVIARLERLLGAPLGAIEGERLTVIARVRSDAEGAWDLRLWSVTAGGTRYRSIHADSCALLADAAALVAAMWIEPERSGDPGDTDAAAVAAAAQAPELVDSAAPEPPPSPAEAGPSTEPLVAEPPPAAETGAADPVLALAPPPHVEGRSRLGWSVGAGAAVAWDGRPGTGAGARVGVGVLGPAWTLGVDLAFGPGTRLELTGDPGELEVGSWTALLRGAWDPLRRARFAAGFGGGLELGALTGRGIGLETSQVDAVPRVAAVAHAAARVRIAGPVWLELAPELLVPLFETRFVVDGLGTAHVPRALGGRVWLGIVVVPRSRSARRTPAGGRHG
jgi:hypothetical protein